MKNIPTANSHWVFTLLVAGSAVLYAVAVFLPGQKSIAAVHTEAHQHAKYIKTVDRQYLAYSGVEQTLRETEVYLDQWRNDAPQAQQFSALLGKITRMAADSKASLKRFTPQAANEWETLLEHPLEAVVEGRFEEIHSFLYGLETLPPTVWVDHLAIQTIDRDEEKLRCELRLKVFSENPSASD
ncbi:MAG: type 4a pilus biogenesis protein PilO [Pirellulaceae bacterium]